MRIHDIINAQKAKFRQIQANKKAAAINLSMQENEKKAAELKQLRDERIRLEGKANLENLRQSELRKIKDLKKGNNKVRNFGKNLANLINKSKSSFKGIEFGGRNLDVGGSPFMQPTKNLDYGFGSGKKDQIEKKKDIKIVIKQ